MGLFEWTVNHHKLAGEHVEQNRLVVVRVGGSPLVIWTQDQLLHNALDAGINVTRQVRSREVEGDEVRGYGYHVAHVASQAKSKHRELVALQGIL